MISNDLTTFAADFMSIQQKISTGVQLGKIFSAVGESRAWNNFDFGLTKKEYEEIGYAMLQAKANNPWFTEFQVRKAFLSLGRMLREEDIKEWLNAYSLDSIAPKRVGIIMAGNVPMVGFHDLLCVLIQGHHALLKLSSDDTVLMKDVVRLIGVLDPEWGRNIEVVSNKMEKFDAVIATGSNNSSRYFESYFKHVPLLIRKNRNSVAVINGKESDEELRAFGDDLFAYFGLGCRNVTKMLIPEGYDLNVLFEALYDRSEIIHHHKYANNYDYNKTVWLLNQEELLDNGFLLIKRDKSLCSPTGSLYYDMYKNDNEVQYYLSAHAESIQCVIGQDHVPFGKSQCPRLWDYADGVDTMKWLEKLN